MAIPLGVFPNGTKSGFHIKNTHISTYFIKKGHAMSAVFIDNAKLFSQLMSKSRNLAEISERRLKLLSVNLKNYRLKVRFCHLITGSKGGGAWYRAPPRALMCVSASLSCNAHFVSSVLSRRASREKARALHFLCF